LTSDLAHFYPYRKNLEKKDKNLGKNKTKFINLEKKDKNLGKNKTNLIPNICLFIFNIIQIWCKNWGQKNWGKENLIP